MDYTSLLSQVAPTTIQQAQGQALDQQGAQQQMAIRAQMAPLQQQAAQIANQSAAQDQENKKLDMGISFLTPILNEQDPSKQTALMKALVPMFNRYVPNYQLDPDSTDVSTIRALAQSRVPIEKQAEMAQQRMMAMGGMGGNGGGIFPSGASSYASLMAPPSNLPPATNQSDPRQAADVQTQEPNESSRPAIDTAFLNQAKTQDPLAGAMAENMIAGTFTPESGKGENDPVYIRALSYARRADPSFNAQSMIGRPAMVKNATAGDMYKLETSLNTGMAHLYDLHQMAPLTRNMPNSSQLVNWIGKEENQAIGGPPANDVSRYEATLNSAAPEIAKYLGGGVASDTGTAEAKGNFSSTLAPNAIQTNAADLAAKMMAKGGSLQNEYDTTMGGAANHQVVNPTSAALFADMQGQTLTKHQQALVNAHRAESNLSPKAWNNAPQNAKQQAQGMIKQPSGTPIVSTQEQFDALPSGTIYVEKDGNSYRKP